MRNRKMLRKNWNETPPPGSTFKWPDCRDSRCIAGVICDDYGHALSKCPHRSHYHFVEGELYHVEDIKSDLPHQPKTVKRKKPAKQDKMPWAK